MKRTKIEQIDWRYVAQTLNRKERQIYRTYLQSGLNPLIFAGPTMADLERWRELAIVWDNEGVTLS